jgi:hypothetical protein
VQVSDAPAGHGGAEVEANIESFGLHGGGQDILRKDSLVKEVGSFGGVQLAQFRDFAERHGEEVSGVVGKPVENQVGQFGAMDDQRGAVIAERGQVRKRTFQRGRIARRLDVFHAPIGVKLLHSGGRRRKGGKESGGHG